MFVVTMAAMLLLGFDMYFQWQSSNELSVMFDFTKNSGVIRKSLTNINIFAYRVWASHNPYSYNLDINSEIRDFYKYSSLTY